MPLRERPGRDGELHVHGRIGDVLVALGDLVVSQSRPAARTVRRDAVVLDEQALVEDLLERPPHRLDVVGRHRPVGVLVVGPVAHPLGHLLERVDVALDVLAALRVELGDAVRLDVGLAGEAEFLLDGEFDGQAVAVPAGHAGDVEALHRLEPREDVLEDAGLDVVRARHAVRGRRALVERPGRSGGGLVEAALEDLPGAPLLDHVAVERGEVDVRGAAVRMRPPAVPFESVLDSRDDVRHRWVGRGTTLVDPPRGVPTSLRSGSTGAGPAPVLPGARR